MEQKPLIIHVILNTSLPFINRDALLVFLDFVTRSVEEDAKYIMDEYEMRRRIEYISSGNLVLPFNVHHGIAEIDVSVSEVQPDGRTTFFIKNSEIDFVVITGEEPPSPRSFFTKCYVTIINE